MPLNTIAGFDAAFGILHVKQNGMEYIGVKGVDNWQYTNRLFDALDKRNAALRMDKERMDSIEEEEPNG